MTASGDPARPEHLRPAFRRAARGKAVIATAGIVVFAGAVSLARQSYASHPKHPARPLTPPRRFVGIVRHNLLQAGLVAPAEAPPEAQTATS